MPKRSADAYDVVIIGAGISGLVCGCYLAKAGMKVLIAEQHHKPGGYCTSFKRKGFTFDAAAHCFGAYRPGGTTRKVFEALGIADRLAITRRDPADTVITPDYSLSYWSDLEKTIDGFQTAFPEEAGRIAEFFHFVLDPDPTSFSRMRSWTFQQLLDRYFSTSKLKAILASPLLGNGGLPPSLMSAFIGAKLFSEFLLDGGYYPRDGMQAIPDSLSEVFKKFGGELRLSIAARRIKVRSNSVLGVILDGDEFIEANCVISNCDARQTFLKLLGKKHTGEDFCETVTSMTPSLSDYVLYLGLDRQPGSFPGSGTGLWFFRHYDLDKAYRAAQEGNLEHLGGFFVRISDDQSTAVAIIPAPYKSKKYWAAHKSLWLDSLLENIDRYALPGLSQHVIYKEAATPQTLERYTRNYRGASFGWAGIPSQLALHDFRKPSFVNGLYLTGHWSTQGLGISGVAYVAYDTARLILKKAKLNHH